MQMELIEMEDPGVENFSKQATSEVDKNEAKIHLQNKQANTCLNLEA